VITTNTLERTDGLTKLTEVLEQIKKVIEANGGVFTIKMAVCWNAGGITFVCMAIFWHLA